MGDTRMENEPLPQRLRKDVEWALRRALDPSDVLPMLHRLARTAAPGSDESVFAHRQLAELLAEKNPWRAAIYAKRVVSQRPEDDRGWALLGLSQTLLGHYRFAVSAYQKALTCAPKNPWYAHNLGHILDVALDRAGDSLYWLRAAYAGAASLGHGANGDIAASFAHALARTGKLAEAKKVLARAMKRGSSKEHSALMKWLEKGAPSDEDSGAPSSRSPESSGRMRAATKRVTKRSATAEATPPPHVSAALARGLENLPLDARQRASAVTLAQDAAAHFDDPAEATGSVAAAIAYGIVFVDDVPLTQAEVAATFRVSVSSLRGKFGELRAQLDLTPGDTRYATR
jgi:tetratricopeptide (TPR) repeat protein